MENSDFALILIAIKTWVYKKTGNFSLILCTLSLSLVIKILLALLPLHICCSDLKSYKNKDF